MCAVDYLQANPILLLCVQVNWANGIHAVAVKLHHGRSRAPLISVMRVRVVGTRFYS